MAVSPPCSSRCANGAPLASPLASLPAPLPLRRCTRGNTGVSFPSDGEGCGAGGRAQLPHAGSLRLPWSPALLPVLGADIPPSARNRSRASGAAKDTLMAWQVRNSPCGVEARN